jgi:hypothetical protein
MKTIINRSAQGDIYIRRVAALPKEVTAVPAVGGRYVVAHSETGHDHWVNEGPGLSFYQSKDPLVAYLRLEGTEGVIEHSRPFSQHESHRFTTGIWELRRQRQMTPRGWERVED